MKTDKAQDKKMVKKAVGMHEKQLHGDKKTNLDKLADGGDPAKSKKYEAMSKAEKEKVQLDNERKRDPKAFDKKKSMYDSAISMPKTFKEGGKVMHKMPDGSMMAGKKCATAKKMAKGGLTKCMSKGCGCEVRGKTKGRMV